MNKNDIIQICQVFLQNSANYTHIVLFEHCII